MLLLLMENENWKKIPSAPLYEVSNKGNVRSLTRTFMRRGHEVTWGARHVNGWVKKSKTNRPIAVMVAMRCHGVTITERVHRLVLEAFVGPCPDGCEGCHNDGDPTNNKLENLRWGTHKSNMQDSIKHNTKTNPPKHGGETHPNSKLTDAQVAEIREANVVHGVRVRLAKLYGVTPTTIGRIIANKQR